MTRPTLDSAALDQLFLSARTHGAWTNDPVPVATLERLYELASMGPTSMNTQPMRLVFITTPQAKERLKPALMPGNVDKTMAAPVTAIVASDSRFYDEMARVWHNPAAREMFAGNEGLAKATAFRNSSLGGAYLIVAARALGLDCGPMSGFDAAKVDAEFFPDGRWQTNFLCNLGVGDASKLMPRNPRLPFEEACRVL